MMSFRAVGNYTDERFAFIEAEEGTRMDAYYDRSDPPRPAIGVGFDLTDLGTFTTVAKSFGVDPGNPALGAIARAREQLYLRELFVAANRSYFGTAKVEREAAMQNALDAKMAERACDPFVCLSNKPALFLYDTDPDPRIRQVFDRIVEEFEGRVEEWLPGIPESKERIALVSLAYSNGVCRNDSPVGGVILLCERLKLAIENGDRAGAYNEIRRQTNGDRRRAGRRCREAEFFGLDGGNPSEVEFTATYQNALASS